MIANEKIKITVAIDIGKGWDSSGSNSRNPERVDTTFLCESRSGGIWRGGIAKEEGVAVVIANEKIKITVAIDIGKGRVGAQSIIRDPEGVVTTFLCESGSRVA